MLRRKRCRKRRCFHGRRPENGHRRKYPRRGFSGRPACRQRGMRQSRLHRYRIPNARVYRGRFRHGNGNTQSSRLLDEIASVHFEEFSSRVMGRFDLEAYIDLCAAKGPGQPTGARTSSASRCSPRLIGNAAVNKSLLAIPSPLLDGTPPACSLRPSSRSGQPCHPRPACGRADASQ